MTDLSDLEFHVELWDDEGVHIEKVLAAADSVLIAVGAFEAAVKAYPEKRVMLRHRTRMIRKSEATR